MSIEMLITELDSRFATKPITETATLRENEWQAIKDALGRAASPSPEGFVMVPREYFEQQQAWNRKYPAGTELHFSAAKQSERELDAILDAILDSLFESARNAPSAPPSSHEALVKALEDAKAEIIGYGGHVPLSVYQALATAKGEK